MAVNIFEMFGTINADDKPAISAIDRVVGKAQTADRTMSKGLEGMGKAFTGVGQKLTSAITKPAFGAATALVGITLVKGFNRLTGIDDARAKLKGLGHDAESVESIMDSAMESVLGTAYGFNQAATIAASAVAAGVESGEELTRYLKITADAAAISGRELSDMGSIINTVQTAQRAYNGQLKQLSDSGIPIYKYLAEEVGVAEGAIRDMASSGEISSEMFLNAIEKNIGGAAAVMGTESFTGAISLIGASISRIGANFLDAGGKGGGFFSTLKPLLTDFNKMLGGVEKKAADLGIKFGEVFNNAIAFVTDLKNKFDSFPEAMQKTIVKSAGFGTLFAVGIGPALKVTGSFITGTSKLARGFENVDFVAGKAIKGVTSTITGLGSKSTTVFTSVGNTLNSGKTNFVNFKNNAGAAMGGFGKIFGGFVTDGKSMFSAYSTMFTNFMGGDLLPAGKGFGIVLEGMKGSLGNFTSGVANSKLGQMFSPMLNSVKSVMPGISEAASGAQALVGQAGGALTSITGKTANALMSVMGIALKLIGPAAIAGVLLVGLGAAQGMFGSQIDSFVQIAITKGPTIISGFIEGIVSKIPDLINQGAMLLNNFVNVLIANLPVIIEGGVQIITALVGGIGQNMNLLIGMAIRLIGSLVQSILSNLPTIIMAGLDLLQALIEGIISNLPFIIMTVMEIITTFSQILTENLPEILAKGIEILISLIEGIIEAIPMLIPIVLEIMMTLLDALIANLPVIIEGGLAILFALINGIIEALPELISTALFLIVSLAAGLLENLPLILEMGGKALLELTKGLIKAIPKLIKELPKIFKAIVEKFDDFDWLGIGKDIIKGMIKGVTNMAGELASAVKSAGEAAFNGVKDFFKIKSPSRKMQDEIGVWLVPGIAQGVEQTGHTLQDSLTDVADNLTFDTNLDNPILDPRDINSNRFQSTGISYENSSKNSTNDGVNQLITSQNRVASLIEQLVSLVSRLGLDKDSLIGFVNDQQGFGYGTANFMG